MNIKVLLSLCFLLGFAQASWAGSSSVWWPGWSVSSSEDLSGDAKYHSYPLPLMFDGDAKTAWVYSSQSNDWDKSEFATRYGVKLSSRKTITIDTVRLMNGQTASRERFLRNNRVLGLRLTLQNGNRKWVYNYRLSDRMGWHDLRFPRRKISSVKLEFTRIKRGRDNDLCISELELRNAGRKIEIKIPKLVMLWDGTEGCGASLLINHEGKMLTGIATDIGYGDEWNPNGRYVAGLSGGEGLWIADVWQRQLFKHKEISGDFYGVDYKWLDNRRLQVKYRINEKSKLVTKIIPVS